MRWGNRIKFIVEVIALITSITLSILWVKASDASYESIITLIGFVIFGTLKLHKDYLVYLFKTEHREFTPAELITHTESFRKKISTEIYKVRAKKLRKDVIIRHVNRRDKYPEAKEGKGISPWFRLGLLDTYHDGIMVGLTWGALVETSEGYRYRDYTKSEEGTLRVILVGNIPYKDIVEINFDGDEYYSFPHIFCYFPYRGEPYKSLYFCQEVDMGHGHIHYQKIADYEDVRAISKRYKLKYFG